MLNQIMTRVLAGASLALFVAAGLFTSARASADFGTHPSGWATCIAQYGCPGSCGTYPYCPQGYCYSSPGTSCGCLCTQWLQNLSCECYIPNPP